MASMRILLTADVAAPVGICELRAATTNDALKPIHKPIESIILVWARPRQSCSIPYRHAPTALLHVHGKRRRCRKNKVLSLPKIQAVLVFVQ